MKISEIISESIISEDPSLQQNENLLLVLLYLKERSEDNADAAVLRTNSVIQLVRNAGEAMFDYKALTTAFEQDPAVKNLIKTFNAEQIVLKSDLDIDDEESFEADEEPEMSPEETVDDMAKSAASKRT